VEAKLFSIGVGLGVGPCTAYCGPIVSPFVLSSGRGALRGLAMALVFSLGRVAAYGLLGAAAGVAGMEAIGLLQSEAWLLPIQAGVGLLLSSSALAIIMGWRPRGGICRAALRLGGRWTGLFCLGALTGLAPCLPLAASLAFVAANAPGAMLGARAGVFFGLGTTLSPLLLLGVVFGAGGRWAERSARLVEVLRFAAGYGLFIYGAHLLFSNLLALAPI